MELSRRHERELARLGEEAQSLWQRQRDVFGRAGDLLKDAGRQAGDIGRDELYPRAKESVAHLAPAVKRWSRRAPQPEPKLGAGSVALMALGAAALAVIGYAVWSTLRADDDLWVDADDDL